MTVHTLVGPGGSKEVTQLQVLQILNDLLTELNGKLEAGQPVELGAASLAALESITVAVSNWPGDFPDAAVLAKLEQIRVLLDGTLDVAVTNLPANYPLPAAQVTALTPPSDGLTDAELRATPVPVSGTISVSEPVTVDGTVNIGTMPEVEIKNDVGNPIPVTGTVSVNEPVEVEGSVDVDNFPVDYPLPASQITTLTPQTDGLTDAELRATPVPVSGTVTVNEPVTIDGTVAVSNFPASTEIANDSGNPIPVTGTVTVNEPVSVDDNGGSLTVDAVNLDIRDLSSATDSVAVTDGGGSLTVDGPVTDAQIRATPLPVSMSSDIEIGAVELKNGTDDTRATVTAANALKVDGSAVAQPVTDNGDSLTVDDGGGSITVDGSVTVSNFPASTEIANDVGNPIPVTGTVAATVSGEVEIKNDSGNPVPVSGTVTITDGSGPVTVDGTVAVSNFPATVEVSNDVGNPLPVSGTVTITDGSGPVTVDGTVAVSSLPEVEVKNDAGSPLAVSGPLTDAQLRAANVEVDANLGQTLSTIASKTITAADAQPGSPWISGWEPTRGLGYVRLLTVLAATNTANGGIFTFEFSEDGATATISEVRTIGDFATVRDFDLINAGAFYRVKFEPEVALGADLVFLNTTLRKQNDGAFVRLATQEIEESNAALGSTFAYLKAFDPITGKSVNIRSSDLATDLLGTEDALIVRSVQAGQQPDADWVNAKADGTVLTDTTGFGANGTRTFTSPETTAAGWFDSDGWATLEIVIASSHISATDGIIIEFSDDVSVAVPVVRSNEKFTFDAADVTRGFVKIVRPIALDGFRVRYINGGVATTSFFIQVNVRVHPAGSPLSSLEAAISGTAIANMGRNALFARNAAGIYALIERGTLGGLDIGIVQHEVQTPLKPLNSLKVQRTSVSTTAVEVTNSTPMVGRKTISIKAICGSQTIYIGHSNAVTSGTGWPLDDDQSIDLEVDATVSIWAIASSGAQAVSVMEVADTTI